MRTERYIEQLLGDIEKLMQLTPPHARYKVPEDIVAQLIDFEEDYLNERGVWVIDYSGITTDQFPSTEWLSDQQCSQLTSAVMKLLEHYNFHPDFPEALPDREKYRTLRRHWHKFKAPLVPFNLHYEFCSYEESHCPFPGYCDLCQEAGNRSMELHSKLTDRIV